MNRVIVKISILFSLILLALFVYLYVLLNSISNYVVPKRDEPYQLVQGVGPLYIVNDLTDNYPRYALRLWVFLYGNKYKNVQKGLYDINGTYTLEDILNNMQQGNVAHINYPTITLVEGSTYLSFVQKMQALSDLKWVDIENLKADDFIKDTLNAEQIEAIGGVHQTLEGLLMPATYIYSYKDLKTTNIDLLKKSLIDMANFMAKNFKNRNANIALKDPYQALILASIVERESSLLSERAQIAGVFYNRLKMGMRLQTDPSVMYGISPLFKGVLNAKMLQKDGPYNTYTRTGLPPTPIAMPSKESIMAVLHPMPTKAIYFVAKSYDPKDGHIFSNTLKEHNKAVAEYKKKVSAYKKELKQKQ